ncbi:phosphoesterase, DHH family protein [Levilactobacillus senmaizukei DSM 21775 = NBRC 103853]|uniref:Phosphoesterase, DHH family protein n=1 Tax=Levilactobacillus senmaizukei DSM 21775 = NBRC 103853 TaxID=1423803 RepID=A0A0R2DED2_9LACO|nr:bifunctional oligoribonuclease/PAP phosphatase NrnA [Levilactobacillus senmaizukei]KRN01894.1 phosphoesterase, DHH family protein [Levilactobacillus senmaizukei DSM 21775 = NBRC 103853]
MAIETAILDKIKAAQTIIIHRHQRPDPDCIGAQLALRGILRASFPDKTVLAVGKHYPGFDWMGQADQDVADDMYRDALVIVVDTANQPRVDDERWQTGKSVIKIDHHPNDDAFGDLQWVLDQASSTSEIIYDWFAVNTTDLTMPDDAARLLYAGIVGDTGRFMYPATSANTLAVAGKLLTYNFSATAVNQAEDEITPALARLSAYLYQNLEILPSGAAFLKLTDEIVESFGLAAKDSTSAIVPLPGKITTVVAWAIFVEAKDHTFRIRLRSKGPSINDLAKHHGGGGHALASGATAHDQAEIDQVIHELDELVASDKGENE